MAASLAIQLYTLRDEAHAGLAKVIERLGRIGYAGVEPAGLHDLAPDDFRRCVEAAGMTISSSHVPEIESANANELLDAQQAMGNDTVVVSFMPPDAFADESAIERSAEALNAANLLVRERGMVLGYHNHWWEFSSRLAGRSAYARLFELLEDSIVAELDTYWAAVGGDDPVAVVRGLGARARLLHIKDGPANDPAACMTAVGEGAIDVPAILEASRADWHIVELDRCASDVFEAVEQSHRYLSDIS